MTYRARIMSIVAYMLTAACCDAVSPQGPVLLEGIDSDAVAFSGDGKTLAAAGRKPPKARKEGQSGNGPGLVRSWNVANGDYDTAAVALMRSGMNSVTLFGSVRETIRMARALGSLDPQRMRDYFVNCFAAGTPILGEHGPKLIEDYQVGERVWARSDTDPNAFAELKPIEQVFTALADIWHVHVGDQVIRTTDEHPFYVRNRGWTSAKDLQPGDILIGLDLNEGTIEEVYDTGEYETVYNFRVAEHHTYFVGEDDWGFAVWAHNTCVKPKDRPGMDKNTVNGYTVSGTAQATTAGGPSTAHATAINNKVAEITSQLQAQGINPDDVCITLNRSWRTALNGLGPISSGANSRLRPDILVVIRRPNGRFTVRAYECASQGQDATDLQAAMSNGFSSTNNNPNFSIDPAGNVVFWPPS